MRTPLRLRGTLLALATACCLTTAAPALAAVTLDATPPGPTLLTPLAGAGDLPPGCGNHWKDPNVRERNVAYDTYIHEMSNACVPYGPIDGMVPHDSTFRLYFADPYEPSWCYGYSVNLRKLGYVLCAAVHA